MFLQFDQKCPKLIKVTERGGGRGSLPGTPAQASGFRRGARPLFLFQAVLAVLLCPGPPKGRPLKIPASTSRYDENFILLKIYNSIVYTYRKVLSGSGFLGKFKNSVLRGRKNPVLTVLECSKRGRGDPPPSPSPDVGLDDVVWV